MHGWCQHARAAAPFGGAIQRFCYEHRAAGGVAFRLGVASGYSLGLNRRPRIGDHRNRSPAAVASALTAPANTLWKP